MTRLHGMANPFGRFWEIESQPKKFEASLFDATGQRYGVLVEAIHFPSAYAKARRLATQNGMSLGKISPV